jgi:hypothetical protein
VLRIALPTSPMLVGMVSALVVLGLLRLLQLVFTGSRDRAVFRYNYYVLLLAIGVFVLGAIVETFVLYNSDLLNSVYVAARLGG